MKMKRVVKLFHTVIGGVILTSLIVTIQRKYIRIYLTLDARKAGILLVRGIYCCRYSSGSR